MPRAHERLRSIVRRPAVSAPAALFARRKEFEPGIRASYLRRLSRPGVNADADCGLQQALEGRRAGLGGARVVSNARHPRWCRNGSPARFRAFGSMAAT